MTLAPLPDPVRIAVDCMGGDHGPSVTLPACKAFLDKHPEAELVLVGLSDALAPAQSWPRTTIVAATEVVTMDDPVETALRRKKDSSMRVAISQVKASADAPAAAQACVSAGNTGALMALARYLLKTLEGIDRPALATVMPNQKDGFTTVLDLGANVDCTAEHLLQFAVMGSALVSAVDGKDSPSVGLLNIGEEVIKGSDFIKQEFTRTLASKLVALVAMPVLNRFKNRVDHRRYSGAALLGLRGLVFKSHGSSDSLAFEVALNRAYDAARHRLLDRVHDQIAATLESLPQAADSNAQADVGR